MAWVSSRGRDETPANLGWPAPAFSNTELEKACTPSILHCTSYNNSKAGAALIDPSTQGGQKTTYLPESPERWRSETDVIWRATPAPPLSKHEFPLTKSRNSTYFLFLKATASESKKMWSNWSGNGIVAIATSTVKTARLGVHSFVWSGNEMIPSRRFQVKTRIRSEFRDGEDDEIHSESLPSAWSLVINWNEINSNHESWINSDLRRLAESVGLSLVQTTSKDVEESC